MNSTDAIQIPDRMRYRVFDVKIMGSYWNLKLHIKDNLHIFASDNLDRIEQTY